MIMILTTKTSEKEIVPYLISNIGKVQAQACGFLAILWFHRIYNKPNIAGFTVFSLNFEALQTNSAIKLKTSPIKKKNIVTIINLMDKTHVGPNRSLGNLTFDSYKMKQSNILKYTRLSAQTECTHCPSVHTVPIDTVELPAPYLPPQCTHYPGIHSR